MTPNPLDPMIDGARKATIHFAKAAFEVASGLGAVARGVARTVRPPDDDGDAARRPQRVPVE
jgi:hypothetical protein